MDQKL
jgi:hypothetical protein